MLQSSRTDVSAPTVLHRLQRTNCSAPTVLQAPTSKHTVLFCRCHRLCHQLTLHLARPLNLWHACGHATGHRPQACPHPSSHLHHRSKHVPPLGGHASPIPRFSPHTVFHTCGMAAVACTPPPALPLAALPTSCPTPAAWPVPPLAKYVIPTEPLSAHRPSHLQHGRCSLRHR